MLHHRIVFCAALDARVTKTLTPSAKRRLGLVGAGPNIGNFQEKANMSIGADRETDSVAPSA